MQRLDLSESMARALFLDYGTNGLKRHKHKNAPQPDPETESDHDADAVKDLEMKVMVQKTVELRVQVKTLEQQARDFRLENIRCKKEISNVREECENAKREKERAEERYQKEIQDLLAEKARMAIKQGELRNELYKMHVEHGRHVRETEKEKWMLGRENRVTEERMSAEVKQREAELTKLRTENEGFQKVTDEISALKEELKEVRQSQSDERYDMVRFQLRVDQVVAMLQCTTLTSEARENTKDDQIVRKSLEELKKITQECAMLRMSRGDDVFEMGRNLLKLTRKIDAKATNLNESDLETKRRRLTQE